MAACSLNTSLPCHCLHRVWRRAFPRSHPRAKMCGKRWCGTSPSTSPSKAPTRMAVSLQGPCRAGYGEVPTGQSWPPVRTQILTAHHLGHPLFTSTSSSSPSQFIHMPGFALGLLEVQSWSVRPSLSFGLAPCL